MSESNGHVSWYQFIAVILPLLVSIVVANYFLNQASEVRLYAEVKTNRDSLRSFQLDLGKIQTDLSYIRALLDTKRDREYDHGRTEN